MLYTRKALYKKIKILKKKRKNKASNKEKSFKTVKLNSNF